MSPEPSERGPELAAIFPSLRTIGRFVALLLIPIIVVALVNDLRTGRGLQRWAEGGSGLAVFAGVLTLFLFVITRPLGLIVYRGGIGGRTSSYRDVFIPWSEISAVKGGSNHGFGFVQIGSRNGGRAILTLPSVLADPDIQRLIGELAGPENPLSLAGNRPPPG